MRHPYKAFVQIQIFTTIASLAIGVLTLVYQSAFLALITCITLAISLGFDGLVEWKKKKTLPFVQQILRSIIIVTFACYLYFI